MHHGTGCGQDHVSQIRQRTVRGPELCRVCRGQCDFSVCSREVDCNAHHEIRHHRNVGVLQSVVNHFEILLAARVDDASAECRAVEGIANNVHHKARDSSLAIFEKANTMLAPDVIQSFNISRPSFCFGEGGGLGEKERKQKEEECRIQ